MLNEHSMVSSVTAHTTFQCLILSPSFDWLCQLTSCTTDHSAQCLCKLQHIMHVHGGEIVADSTAVLPQPSCKLKCLAGKAVGEKKQRFHSAAVLVSISAHSLHRIWWSNGMQCKMELLWNVYIQAHWCMWFVSNRCKLKESKNQR